MLTYAESVMRFRELRAELHIPPDAIFTQVEKRRIEQFPDGEIEPMEGAAADGSGIGYALDRPVTERLVWVGEFYLGFTFWKLAIDENGRLVRLRKSR